jgi:formylmethanofuran dehydrogenase subunit A
VPAFVIKAGQILIENFEVRQTIPGKTIAVSTKYDLDRESEIENWFDRHYSLRSAHFGVRQSEYSRIRLV